MYKKILAAILLSTVLGIGITLEAQTPKKEKRSKLRITIVRNGVATPISDPEFEKVNRDSIASVDVIGDSIVVHMKPSPSAPQKK